MSNDLVSAIMDAVNKVDEKLVAEADERSPVDIQNLEDKEEAEEIKTVERKPVSAIQPPEAA